MTITSPPASASNADLIRWSFEALNRHDASALRQIYAQEIVERFPDRTCRGPDEVVAYFEDAFVAIPDFHIEADSLVERGDEVFVQWHLTGTHGGPLNGIEATGKPLSVDGIDHFVFRDGKITSNFVVFDQMQYARQIGMLPADASAGDKALKATFNARTKVSAQLRRARH